MASNMIGLSPSGQSGYGLAQAMLEQSMQPRPIQSHLQGIGQLAQALSGAYRMSRYDDERDQNLSALSQALASPEGLSSPGLVQQIAQWNPEAAINLASTNREYGAEQSLRDAMLGLSGQSDNPMYNAALLSGDLGTAYQIQQDEAPPRTYGGQPSGASSAGNNNLLNIRATNASWQGETTQPGQAFESFSTPEEGVRAAVLNLMSYADRGVATVGEALAQWAPAGDGNNDPAAYAAAVEQIAGIPPDTPLDPHNAQLMSGLLGAMAQVEQGAPVDPAVIDRGVQMAYGQATGAPVDLMGQQQAGGAMTPPADTFLDDNGQPVIEDINGEAYWMTQRGPVPVPQQAGDPYGEVNGMQGENARILLSGDPASPEYAYAYAQEFQTPRYVQTDRGVVPIMNPVPPGIAPPTNPIMPLEQGTPGQPTVGSVLPGTGNFSEAQFLSAGFAERLAQANTDLESLVSSGYDPTSLNAEAQALMGDLLPGGNFAVSEGYQRYEQARREFINAQLRRESGAVISDEEFENANQQYFPMPGDSPAVVEQKRRSRELAIQNMINAAGGALETPPSTGQGQSVLRYERDENGILRQVQ